jgi:hypothetical protein
MVCGPPKGHTQAERKIRGAQTTHNQLGDVEWEGDFRMAVGKGVRVLLAPVLCAADPSAELFAHAESRPRGVGRLAPGLSDEDIGQRKREKKNLSRSVIYRFIASLKV